MDANLARVLGAIGAGIAVLSTVGYYILKWKELRTLREIRDRMPKPGPK
jgi:hypothetical protein